MPHEPFGNSSQEKKTVYIHIPVTLRVEYPNTTSTMTALLGNSKAKQVEHSTILLLLLLNTVISEVC